MRVAVVVVIASAWVALPLFAQEEAGPGMGRMRHGMRHGMMERGRAPDEDAGPVCPCPMHGGTARSMIATDDGGVIVMSGGRLLKYDRDLNLKKKVEIEAEPSAAPAGPPQEE